ncbi:nuclear receptor coactivator 7-like isoform X1 [Zingiber officinale]|uniref:nuclear receptor coactivator 7-like isoform X1 n=2 Tax=Zingiber officinale TaxID=94328 RepID=UPI001C4AEA30|nr:nuclear receptor coactivator 7-like isoform X1 [Zingiber officinale]
MGYLPSLGSKAVHLVSGITSAYLNPISDEPADHSEENLEAKSLDDADLQGGSKSPNVPDTTSFTAFMISLLSSSNSSNHLPEDLQEHHAEEEERISKSVPNENSGRKGILARGKKKLGKVIHKAAKMSGFRHNSVPEVDCNILKDSELKRHELSPVEVTKNDATLFDLPEMSEPSLLLSHNTRAALYFSLPTLVKGRNWLLLYSTWRHGISLSTLYRRSTICPGYSLLVVGDQKGAVFGGLVEAPLQPTSRRKYQGTNISFVFSDVSGTPVIFRPTGSNHYFTLCSSEFLALGGGGHFALYLDGDLLNGSSSSSETFGNSCLAHTEDFEVKEVELWAFVYASKYDEIVDLCRTEKPGICRW